MSAFMTKERFTDHNICKRFFAASANTGKWKVLKAIIGGLFGTVLFGNVTMATTCGSYPYTFSNGTTADAGQVNSNFSSILSCANTLLAPIDNPSFTTRVQVNTTGSTALFDVNTGNTYTTSGNYLARIGGTFTSSSTTASIALLLEPTFNPSGTFTSLNGLELVPVISSSLGSNVSLIRGELVQPSIGSGYTGVVANAYGIDVFDLSPANDLSTTNYYEFRGEPITNGNGATSGTTTNYIFYSTSNTAAAGSGGVVNNYGAFLNVGSGSGAGATNNYGLRIYGAGGSGGSGTTNNYGIYDDSTANNFFSGKVGIGTSNPAQALEVNGEVKVDTFASASGTAVCQNANILSSCSSSIRYKENVKDAPFGLNEVEQMRPVTFKWKGRDENDLGLIAEEVAKINPLFVTYKDGKIEGVKYAQLAAVLVGAIKELKRANDNQAAQIVQLQNQISELQRKTGLRSAMNGSPLQRARYSTGQQ